MSLNLVSTLMSGKKTREEYIALTKYDYGALPEEQQLMLQVERVEVIILDFWNIEKNSGLSNFVLSNEDSFARKIVRQQHYSANSSQQNSGSFIPSAALTNITQ